MSQMWVLKSLWQIQVKSRADIQLYQYPLKPKQLTVNVMLFHLSHVY